MSGRRPSGQSARHGTSEEEPQLSASEEHLYDPLRGHNRRLAALSAAPARTYSPEIQASLVQPGGSFTTPHPEDVLPPEELATAIGRQQASVAGSAGDYFSPFATRSHSVGYADRVPPDNNAQTPLSRHSTRSSDTSSRNNPEHFRMESSLGKHFANQRDAIVKSSSHKASSPISEKPSSTPEIARRSMAEPPHYPNQALSALSSQIHPELHHAPYASRPTSGFRRQNRPTGVLSRIWSPSNSGDERPTRTVGNTPIATPQLFSPRFPQHGPAMSDDGDSPIPSPYLHPVQPQAPKETNKATRDFDTSSGRKTINQYEILYEIGKGAHGKVKLARTMASNDPVAIKIVQRYSKKRRLGKAQSQEDKVKKEIAILKKALHPNVVSMIEVIDDPDFHKIYLVLEFCEAHDVKWREIGQDIIVYLEYRRLKSEYEGGVDAGSGDGQSDRLLRAASRRQKLASHRRSRPLSRINSESQFFSLEYGGNSDFEEDDQASSAPDSAISRDDSESFKTTNPASASIPNLDSASRSPDDVPINKYSPQPIHGGPVEGNEDPSNPELWNLQEFQAEMQRRVDAAQPSEDNSEDRKSSVAESNSSEFAEAIEKITEEEMHHVPLLTLSESRRAFRDALLGLEYLHYQGIIHRDIKPENLLRKADHSVKISDFGVSYLGKPIREGKESEETSDAESPEYHEDEADLAKTVGTPAFYAPELCSLDYAGDRPRVTGQIDVWALGVTLFCFVYARLPFQANNEFMMMRHIDEQEPFISRKRLKAVDTRARSIHGPSFPPSRDRRLPHELAYEGVDQDLYDLLQRLLVKDPTKRITVKEIKHHPWVLRDIHQPEKWIEDTDPSRFTKGQKIEISHKEIVEAVAPLRILERAKSVAKKVVTALGAGASRKRGQSSATSSEVSSSSPGPLSGGASFIAGDHSRSEESIATTSKASREQLHHHQHAEHPLSQSVTASPELPTADKQFDWMSPQSPLLEYGFRGIHDYIRPRGPARQESVMSTAGSAKTVTPSDFVGPEPSRSREPKDKASLSAPETQQPQTFSHMLGEAGRNLLRSVRSRDRAGLEAPASKSPEHHESLQGEPSVAVSSTSVTGHLSSIRDVSRSSNPYAKRHSTSLTSQELPGRDSSPLGADMREVLARRHMHHLEHSVSHGAGEQVSQENLSQNLSFLQLPPSGQSPGSRPSQPTIGSSSSDDRFTSELSREASFPSVPSVVSADSSVALEWGIDEPISSFSRIKSHDPSKSRPASYHGAGRSASISTPPLRRPPMTTSRSVGPVVEDEQGVETDEDDSESDEEFLVMNKSKSKNSPTPKMSARHGSAGPSAKR